jgi:IPT/TIG domain
MNSTSRPARPRSAVRRGACGVAAALMGAALAGGCVSWLTPAAQAASPAGDPVSGTATGTQLGGPVTATPPVVTGVSINRGYTQGGLTVTVTGTNLDSVISAAFGAVPATLVGCSDTTCIVVSPAVGETGVTDIRLTSPAGSSAVVPADQFYYIQKS